MVVVKTGKKVEDKARKSVVVVGTRAARVQKAHNTISLDEYNNLGDILVGNLYMQNEILDHLFISAVVALFVHFISNGPLPKLRPIASFGFSSNVTKFSRFKVQFHSCDDDDDDDVTFFFVLEINSCYVTEDRVCTLSGRFIWDISKYV